MITPSPSSPVKIGIAGMGAIGSAVAKALMSGIEGFHLEAVSDLNPKNKIAAPYVSLQDLAARCDLIVEALPPAAVPELTEYVFKAQKNLVLISSCAVLLFPEVFDIHSSVHKAQKSRIFIPSGALAGLDGVKAMREMGIKTCKIASTKPPLGFSTAPYIVENYIDLQKIDTMTCLFKGNALEAAKGFPANVNVAASLSIASGLGGADTQVEIWADPAAKGNAHEITVETDYSRLKSRIENLPDPANPKSSVLAAQSIVALLKNMNSAISL